MADEDIAQIAQDPELERARTWWREHGRPIVAGLAIGLSAVAGFNFWQNHQETRAENASVLFERLRSVIESEDAGKAAVETDADSDTENETEDETDAETETNTETETESENVAAIQSISEELMSDYDATPYAVHGAFALAKFSVDNDDFDRAAQALQWIVDNGDDDALRHIARLRLATVWLAQGEAESVVTLLDVAEPAEFTARYHELTGDALLQTDDIDGARSAYQRGINALEENDAASGRILLQLKLDNLGE